MANKQKSVYSFQRQEEVGRLRFECRQRKKQRKTGVKNLGIVLGRKLKFDEEVKKILHRMACGVTVYLVEYTK